MVRTWNREPSPDQAKAKRDASPRHTPAVIFQTNNPRFAYDGKVRVPNFLNGLDGQLLEARGHIAPTDTCTHTRYDFASTGVGNLGISMAAEIAKSINSVAVMRSVRPKSATARSLVANDTRYSHLEEPHKEHVGPGAYEVERTVPGVGQMAPDSHTCSATPQRDPYRSSAAFLAPERPGSAAWIRPGGPDAVYISPEFVPSPDRAPSWSLSNDKRLDASEWRHNHARVMAAVVAGAGTGGGAGAGSAAPEAPYSSDLPADVAGRPLELSLRATLRNPHGVSFSSREPRLTALPPERTADLRASRLAALRGPDDTAHLGPGSYTPPISVGGPRRRTYRIYVDPLTCPQPSDRFGVTTGSGSAQADAAAVVAAREHGTARAAAAARAGTTPSSPTASVSGAATIAAGGGRSLSARSQGSSCGSIGSAVGSRSVGGTSTTRLGGGGGASSAAFSGPYRGHKMGAFDWRTDSSLVKY